MEVGSVRSARRVIQDPGCDSGLGQSRILIAERLPKCHVGIARVVVKLGNVAQIAQREGHTSGEDIGAGLAGNTGSPT